MPDEQRLPGETRLGVWLVLTVIIGGLLYLLAPVLTPFLFAALLAYLGDPVADYLETHRFSRTWAVVTVFSIIFLVLLLLLLSFIPLLGQEISNFIRRLPVYLGWLPTRVLPWLQNTLGIDLVHFDLASLREQLSQSLGRVGNIAAGILSSVTRSTVAIIGWLANLILIPVVTFYLLRDWDLLIARIRELLPRRIEPVMTQLTGEANEVLGAFLRGQLMVMLALGVIYSLGLATIGLEFSLLIGMLAGLISFVPYLGSIVGVLMAGIAALVQFQDLLHLFLVLMVFGIGQALEGMVLTPWLVGDRIGIHPVAVIFAVLAGGHLFGFFGVLLALPAAAVVMVLLRHAHDEYLKSRLYSD
jgi:predicted PurR-regulated permease PerM